MAAISDVFETGSYDITSITVTTSHASKPPVELFIIAPTTNGTYPVLLFCHGFYLTNTWYSSLLQHIASHGYIIVAPMVRLHSVLPNNVNRDDDKLALSGHSRGGKTAFTLALAIKNTPSKFKALIGIDPVAGSSSSMQLPPKILQYIPRSFDMSIPVAVIGTEYGNQRLGLIPPFAPDGVNHLEFFSESKPPVCYLLANGYGHCDILDDWIAGYLSYICKSGKGSKDSMRK
ncbi:hypothetical protein RD792_003207 [Penstemon davidsonii]|uniref:Chlorophyllase n=1 Tax=Penstemon davidsonii TaxID=160366 RepID=A0ABR0DT56_9LAMI|nr:hypothetical protein RD792_003207 [Penstemon davidsonii]